MLTAAQARTNALSINEGLAKENLESIEKVINHESQNGKFTANVGNILPQVKLHLEKLGYKVEISNFRNETNISISW